MGDEEEFVDEMELIVVESRITRGGIARVNKRVLDAMKLANGDHVVVKYGKKSILVKIIGDNLIDEGEISLRAKDRKRLGVREGDYVVVSRYSPLRGGLLKRMKIKG